MEEMQPKKQNALMKFLTKVFTHEGKLRPCFLPLTAIIALMVVAAVGIHTILSGFSYQHNEIGMKPEDIGIVEMDRPEGITNIALFGIDARNETFRGLSDSIMIISIDANHNSIKIISIMRDSLVKVDGYGHQKINAAYNLGGPKLAIKTLNQTFNMDISEYATVDFVSMAGLIDAVGGIEAELTEGEVKNANKQIREMARQRKTPNDQIQQAGKQKLSGIQAVAFARIRKTATINGTNNDFGRTERQRYVMGQLFEKALATSPAKYPAMIKALLPYMETSLDYQDVFELAGLLASKGVTFEQARIPADRAIITWGLRASGLGSCMYYDLDYAAELLHAFIYDDIPFEDYMDQNGVRKNDWYTGGVAGSTDSDEEEEEPIDPSLTDPNAGGVTDPNAGGVTDPNAGGITDPNAGGVTDPNGGDQSGGDQSGGDQSGGDQSGGDQSGGDQSGSDQSGGDQSGGDQSGGDQSGGDQSGGDQSGGDQSGGDQNNGGQSGGGTTPVNPVVPTV